MRRFFAAELPSPGQQLTLDAEVSHHLLRVTGVAPQERIRLFDGAGLECEAQLIGAQGGLALVEGVNEARRLNLTQERVLLVGLPKKPAWELALRMVTELGATELRPFVAQRSVATGDHQDRWDRIVREAARQCGRAEWPRVHPLGTLEQQLRDLPEGARYALTPGAQRAPRPEGALCLLTGPEGGLTNKELALAERGGFVPVGLGPLTLRADTAMVAGLAAYGL